MKKTFIVGAALAVLSVSAFAQRAPTNPTRAGTINITGEIIAGACSIDPGSLDQTVQLGFVPVGKFKAAGDRSIPKKFDIKLTDCDPSVAAAAFFTFTGAPDANQAKLISTVGSATNVGIRLKAVSGEYFDNGVEQKAGVVLDHGSVVAHFAAMYEATAASATAGTADGVVNFTVRYQ